MNKKIISLAVVSVLSLVGCGGGSSSTDNTSTGTFVDAPVSGLHYITATQNSYTNALGQYKYIDGETVEFKLGNLSLGSIAANSLVTPYTIAGSTGTTLNTKATNIAMILQNFDSNRADTSSLDVTKLKDYVFTEIDLDATSNTVSIAIAKRLSEVAFQSKVDATHLTPISATTVNTAMKTYVESAIAADVIAQAKKAAEKIAAEATESSSSTTTTSSTTFTLESADISGHTLTVPNATTVFSSNGTFSNVKPSGLTTPGTWSVSDNKIKIQYSDTSLPEYWGFTAKPVKGGTLTRTKDGEATQTGEILSFS